LSSEPLGAARAEAKEQRAEIVELRAELTAESRERTADSGELRAGSREVGEQIYVADSRQQRVESRE
jgi:hypothetical protein